MILKKSMANFRLTVKKEAFYQGIPGPGHWFFFIHILKRQYDKNYKKVYHIAFFHILKFSKSLSYLLYHIFKYTKKCSFSAIFPKFHHIAVYHILKNFIIFSLSYFNMIKNALYHIFLDF